MCGCEEQGEKFCDFTTCNFGNCESCDSVQNVDDCDLLATKAGARDCKLRCFDSYDNDFSDDEFYCGQFNKHIVTSLAELPEKERLKFCHYFYPLSNPLVPIPERDECYTNFNIEISTSKIYDECHEKLDDFSDY